MITGLLVLFISALVGVVVARFLALKAASRMEYALLIVGGYLVGVTLFHMVPHLLEHFGVEAHLGHEEAHHHHGDDHDTIKVQGWIIGAAVIVGFFLHSLLERLMGGSDHGHVHVHEGAQPILLLGSICLHAFFEGSAIMFANDSAFLLAIALHKTPAGFALGTLIFHRYGKGVLGWGLLLPFLLASPVGYIFSHWMLEGEVVSGIMVVLIEGLVVGTFLQIGVVVLWEKIKRKSSSLKDWALFLGAIALAGGIHSFF